MSIQVKNERTYVLSKVDIDDLIVDILNYLSTLEGVVVYPSSDFPGETQTTLSDAPVAQLALRSRSEVCLVKSFDDERTIERSRFYFGGAQDSDRPYEIASNHLRIATKAKNEIVGLALHQLLCLIVNEEDRYELLNIGAIALHDDMTEGGRKGPRKWTISEIVAAMAKETSMFSMIHDLDRDGVYATTELTCDVVTSASGGGGGPIRAVQIRRFIGEIDVWDTDRIAEAMEVWSQLDKYKLLGKN